MLTDVNQILICLVGDHDQVASLRETRHSFRFFASEDNAGRILRRVVVDGPGAIAGIALQYFFKTLRSGNSGWDQNCLSLTVRNQVLYWCPVGREDENFFAGIND